MVTTSPPARPRRRRLIGVLLALGAAGAAAALLGPLLLSGQRMVADRVVRRDFVETIVASGRVQAPRRVALGVQVAGSVLEVPVSEGQSVAAGQPLLALDAAEWRAVVAQSESGVRQAQARVRQVVEVQRPVAEQALLQAGSNRDTARSALQRSRELFGQGFVGAAALQEAERAASVAEAQWQSAQRQLAGAAAAGSDLAAAQAALAQARATADLARARLAYATLRAPVAGLVVTRNVQPGDAVQPGKVLLTLAPAGAIEIVCDIDERHLAQLRPGLPAQFSPDAYERERIPAQVSFVHPAVDVQRGSVEVRLRVPAPPDYLRQDMTVSVEIEVARRAGALLVPSDAVHETPGSGAWVWLLADGKAQRQPVELGLRTPAWSEVVHGLAPGATVLTAADTGIGEGQRVRAVYRTPAP